MRRWRRSDVVRDEPEPRQRAELDCDPESVARPAVRLDERMILGSQRDELDQVVEADLREAAEPLLLRSREHAPHNGRGNRAVSGFSPWVRPGGSGVASPPSGAGELQ